MSKIQEIFQTYGPEYVKRYGNNMPSAHRKAIAAIVNCRTGELGMHEYACPSCGKTEHLPRSCGNRHCPSCQQHKARAWLHKQMQKLLPCSYFLLTFTVPEELRRFIRTHQRIAYSAMFDAASASLKKLARDQRFIGADQTGFFAVLHTWGRLMQYNPHIHVVMPGGGLSARRDQWMGSEPDFLVHVKALSPIYRAKLRDAIDKAGLLDHVDPDVWRKPWVVNCKAVGNGKWTLRYLSRYVFRVAISNNRIISCHNGMVTFRWRKVESRRWRKTTIDAMEFIRRFLQHVLPTGLMKIRHYGFLGANAKVPIQRIRELICDLYEFLANLIQPPVPHESPPRKCPSCGTSMVHRALLSAGFIHTG
jgi:ribosomal protein L37AE/L43A